LSIVKLDIDSKIIFEDASYIIKGYSSLDEILAKQIDVPYSEKIIKVSEIIKEPKNASILDKQLVDINDEEFKEALDKYLIIEPLLKIEKRTTKDVDKVAKKHNRGIATIYRWLDRFETIGTVSSLSTSYENCGAKGKSRLNESVNAIIEAVLEDLYLNKQQYPLSFIHMKIVEKCNNLNLKAPNINTIRNRIKDINPKLIAKHRKGTSIRDTRGTPGKFPDVKMPLDVIQIDHTKMDVIIVDEKTRQEIGRPFITVAIDVYSRMIYGFYISLEAPSYFSVGQCLLNAILPKDDILKNQNVEGEWPVYGLPRAVHVDNAKEFRGISLQKFCQEYRITDIYRPVARPEFGAHVERVIKTAMQNVHLLPGATFSNIFDKGTYDSQKEAAMTIDELEQWYTDFVVNIYHKVEHSSIGMTPEEKLYQGMFGVGGNIPFLPTVPADTLKLRMSLLPSMKRTVQKNGITIDYITYFSETLRKWIVPASYKRFYKDIDTKKVICRRDPRDISKIYIYDEDTNDYIVVPYSDIKRPAINLKELRKSIAEAKKLITGREIESHDIFSAYNRLYQYAEKSKREKKSVRRAISSKKHMQKTLEEEKQILPSVKNDVINLSNSSNDKFEDDEDGFEYYPVG